MRPSKQLLSLWDKRLRDSGFQDAEKNGELIQWDSHYFHARYTPDEFQAKQEYYQWAEALTHTHPFKSETDRHIWKLHAEGMSVREIARKLKARGVQTHKDHVARTIVRIRGWEVTAKCKSETSSQLELFSLLIKA